MNAKGLEERSVGQAMWRGTKCKCPHCGQGHMFQRYLKVADNCDACGEQLGLHRADDFPPYIAITIVGHILVGIMMFWDTNPLSYFITLLPLAVILPLLLLPSIKGSIVGLQWANGMYGFGAARRGSTAA